MPRLRKTSLLQRQIMRRIYVQNWRKRRREQQALASTVTIDLVSSDDSTVDNSISENFQDREEILKFKKRLIVQVRKNRPLYDKNHNLFSNVAKKEEVWLQIAKKLKSDVTNCKDTWFELRYSYQRYARNLRNYFIHKHKGNRKRPAMALESELMFLWQFIDNRKTCKIPFEIPESNELQIDSGRRSEIAIEKVIDDDLVLLDPPVESIVIDEDDDNGKSVQQFKLSTSKEDLIAQVKKYPELFNSQHVSFKDFSRKSYIWNSIASNLGEKATKLMKWWICMQTRYEWEISHPNQNDNNEAVLELFRGFILKNHDTVYKQSYFLKNAWYDPFDYFKDTYNLIENMKKLSNIVHVTESLLNTPEKTKQYIDLWSKIARLNNTSAGQCETTWLIMRHFYWELMCMRNEDYHLTDKWYFEALITDLYAIAKPLETSKLKGPEHSKSTTKHTKNSNEKPKIKYTKRSSTKVESYQDPKTNKGTSPIANGTTTLLIPTIINDLQTQSTTFPQFTLPKITAAVSLAPQALNGGTVQINQIPSLALLPPAPHSFSVSNGTATTDIPSSTTAMENPHTALTFNLPSQTKLVPIQMPSLIRSSILSNTQPTIKNPRFATISVRPQSSSISPLANIQQITWPPLPTLMPIQRPETNINTMLGQNVMLNPPTSTLYTNNTNTIPSTTASVQITTAPFHRATDRSPNIRTSTSTNTTTIGAITTPSTTDNTTTRPLPKITSVKSMLNANEFVIEFVASPSGNELVVHGPSMKGMYYLPMPLVAIFIREVLAIPLLHSKRGTQPALINCYWEYVGTICNLPVNVCRACWNFLKENISYFPNIAPLKELMKPFHTELNVWKETTTLFSLFDAECDSKGWSKHMKTFPYIVECISGYPTLYKDISKDNYSNAYIFQMESFCAWGLIRLRFPGIPEIEDIWAALKNYFVQYMNDIEIGIENKWSDNCWRSFARMKFLVEARYTINEPLYYIITNKMIEQTDKRELMETKKRNQNDDLPGSSNEETNTEMGDIDGSTNDLLASLMDTHLKKGLNVELGTFIAAIEKYPDIYGKADNMTKFKAWRKVAQELHMEVPVCLFAFKHVIEMYFAYKKQDRLHPCPINQIYYKKLDQIINNLLPGKFPKPRGKINVKTPFQLNQSVEMNKPPDDLDLVFPERYISDISMSNSPSNLVVKNWICAIGNISNFNECSDIKFKDILRKYLPNF